MKRMQPTAWFWIVAAAIAAVALFTVGNVYGQSTGAKAVYEGRPAMAGAQAGTGAMAGPPQGGLAPQGVEEPGGGVPMPRRGPGGDGPSVPRDPGLDQPSEGGVQPQRDRDSGDVVKRERDQGALGDEQRATKKAKRAGKRSVERARRGVSGIDS